MRNYQESLTLERLRQRLSYNPDTGVFTWLSCEGLWKGIDKRQSGTVAGCIDDRGYCLIKIDGVSYLGHRLAWFYMKGSWPTGDLDHQDLDKSNNRWSNLRAASHGQNMHNVRMRKNNKAGFKGVYYNKGAFQATIRHENKSIYIGRFATAEAAHDAYLEAAKKFYSDFARSS